MPDAAALDELIADAERHLAKLRRLRAEIGGNASSKLDKASNGSTVGKLPGVSGLDHVEALRMRCRENGIAISVDDYISETALAAIVQKAVSTVKGWRLGARPIPYRKIGNRCEYHLADVAAFLASGAMVDD